MLIYEKAAKYTPATDMPNILRPDERDSTLGNECKLKVVGEQHSWFDSTLTE
jgi:hypothetical protein